MNKITITWHIKDVKKRDKELTDEQAKKVLERLQKAYDPYKGITWDMVEKVSYNVRIKDYWYEKKPGLYKITYGSLDYVNDRLTRLEGHTFIEANCRKGALIKFIKDYPSKTYKTIELCNGNG